MSTQRHEPTSIWIVLSATGGTLAAALVRLLLDPLLEDQAPFLLFVVAAAVVSVVNGTKAGLLSTLLGGLVGVLLFTEPRGTLRTTATPALVELAIYAAAGAVLSVLSGALHAARRRGVDERTALQDSRHEAPARNAELMDNGERKLTEQGVLRNRAHERAFLDHLPVGIWFLEANGRIHYCNAAARRIWGGARYVGKEGYGEYVAYWHGTDRRLTPDDWAAARALRHRETSLDEEVDIVTFEGTRKTILNSAVPVVDDAGAVLGAVVFNQDITDRKRAEQALWEAKDEATRRAREAEAQEQQIASLLESIGDGFFAVDGEWRIVYVNGVAERLLGLARADVLGVGYWDVFPKKLGTHAEDEYRRAFAGESREFEHLYEPWNRWFHNRCFPREGGGMSVFFADVTAQKRAQQELQRVQALIEGIAQGTEDLIAAVDHELRYSFCNDAYRREFSRLWARDVETGDCVHEVLEPWPEEKAKAVALWRRALAGESFSITISFGPAAGEQQVYELRFSPIHDGDGQHIGAAHILRNVTDRERMQLALRDSEARFRNLADAMPQLVWTAGPDGTVDYYNARVDQFDGLVRDANGTGWNWEGGVHPEDAAGTVAAWRAAVETRTEYRIEHRIRMRAGGHRWFLSRAVPVRDETGRVKWYGTATDIHAIKQAEQELREADRQKDDFLATIAHELRNPLAPLRYGLDLLRTAGEPERAPLRTMMERQLLQLVRIVDDLLEQSRISRGRILLQRQPTELAELVQQAVESVRPIADGMGHRIDVERDGQDLRLHADPTRIVQAVSNLLHNACKFTPPGGRIAVRMAVDDGWVTLRVIDEGIGLTREQLATVFDRFTRTGAPLARMHGGLGIGLPLAKQLVEQHGGTLTAASAGPGRGSEFVLRLPAGPIAAPIGGPASDLAAPRGAAPAQPQATGPGSSTGAEGAAEPRPSPPSALRVLVVDDNADTARSAGRLLELQGHEVRLAFDGDEAVATAESFRPHLVLLDIGLPKRNGYEVCRHVRAQAWGRDPMLVAVTGWGQAQDRARALDSGFDAHLTKPVDPAALHDVLARAASR